MKVNLKRKNEKNKGMKMYKKKTDTNKEKKERS